MRVALANPYIAHRGAGALAPENTLPAYEAARRVGASAIEVDVWRTTDGKLVIMHDDTVDATTNGHGRVDSFSFDQIRALDAGSWFSPQFKGAQVPTLGEVLQFAHKSGMKVDIHVREADRYPGLEKDVADCIRSEQAANDVLVTAFEPGFLGRLHQYAPELETGTLLDVHPMLNTVKKGLELGLTGGVLGGLAAGAGWLGTAGLGVAGAALGFLAGREVGLGQARREAAQAKTPVVLPFWAQCDGRFVKQAHAHGKAVIPYVEDAPGLAHWLLRRDGVEAVITDNPERFQASS